jgi:hypothetical protein
MTPTHSMRRRSLDIAGYLGAALLLTVAVGLWSGAAAAVASGNHDGHVSVAGSSGHLTDRATPRSPGDANDYGVYTGRGGQGSTTKPTPGPATRACQPTPTPTPTPTTAVPTTAVPTTAVPTTAVPTTAVPTTAVPTTAAPTTAAPEASQSPVSSAKPSQQTSVLPIKLGRSSPAAPSNDVLPDTGGQGLVGWTMTALGLVLAGSALLLVSRNGRRSPARRH